MSEDSRIILPSEEEEVKEEEGLLYKATDDDEEKFLLMYHLNLGVADVDSLSKDRRQWILARFMHQKRMEDEQMHQMHLQQQMAQGNMPNIHA